MALQVPDSFIGVGTGDVTNRVTVIVPVADSATIRSIVKVVDDPAMLRIHGSGHILDGDLLPEHRATTADIEPLRHSIITAGY